jgi:DNA topoisomerase-1
MTLERGLELLAGRRAWELENGDAPKKSSRKAAKKAPTLTEKTLDGVGAKKRAKKSATGRSKKEATV